MQEAYEVVNNYNRNIELVLRQRSRRKPSQMHAAKVSREVLRHLECDETQHIVTGLDDEIENPAQSTQQGVASDTVIEMRMISTAESGKRPRQLDD